MSGVGGLTRPTYAAVPGFVAREGRTIVNIASIVAISPETLSSADPTARYGIGHPDRTTGRRDREGDRDLPVELFARCKDLADVSARPQTERFHGLP